MATRKLGKGLNSLLSSRHADDAAADGGVRWVSVTDLQPNRQQPRIQLDKGLEDLAESIRQHGILQPIVVTEDRDGGLEILAGERRWRAARLAGLRSVPILVREGVLDDTERLELAFVENVQREDLDPIERAKACQSLLVQHGLTQERMAERIGISRSAIANLVRLLELPAQIQDLVSRETITEGHARALLRLNTDPAGQGAVLERVLAEELSVRATEAVCRHRASGRRKPQHRANPRQPSWAKDLQERLTRGLGLRTELRFQGRNRGRLTFHFRDLDDLDRLTQKLDLPSEIDELS